MSFRLYAARRGSGSWARIAAGCEDGLTRFGALAGFVDLSTHDLYGGTEPEGHDSTAGLALGSPPSWDQPFQLGSHAHKLALIAPNSTWVPQLLGTLLQHGRLTGLVAPSRWAQKLLKQELGCPVWLWQHGIDDRSFYPDRDATAKLAGEPFRVLHLASSTAERKGTIELLHAWNLLWRAGALKDGAKLTVVAPPVVAGLVLEELAERLSIKDSVDFPCRVDGTTASMRQLYQGFHVLCQPSRAEGFGSCLRAGTVITARRGAVPIEDITVWDEVLGADGHWHRVTATSARRTKRVLRIKISGAPDLVATKEHLVLAAERLPRERFRKFAAVAKPRWVRADRLTADHYLVLRGPRTAEVVSPPYSLEQHCNEPLVNGDLFTSRYSNRSRGQVTAKTIAASTGVNIHSVRAALQPSREAQQQDPNIRAMVRDEAERQGFFTAQRVWLPRAVNWTPSWCRLLGYYAGDGCASLREGGGGSVEWCLSDAKSTVAAHVCEELQRLGLSWNVQKRGKRVNIFCSSAVMARAMTDLCGRGARNKHLPAEVIWSLPDACRSALLEGLYRTDGHNGRGCLAFCSTSATLALQARDLWLSLGVVCSLRSFRMSAMRQASLRPLRKNGRPIKSHKVAWMVSVQGKAHRKACGLLNLEERVSAKTGRRGGESIPLGDGCWLVRVRDITKERTNLLVHDLQVPTAESFVAGGVVVHNCPIEARASGVPVVATACTGHDDHPRGIGWEVVSHGAVTTSDDGPGALAPTVSPDAIASALAGAVLHWEELATAALDEAEGIRRDWSWSATTGRFLESWHA